MTVVHGDITNLELLVHIVDNHKVSHIYHLAAEAIVSQYTKSPRDSYLHTVYGVTTILEAVRIATHRVLKVVVSTSYKVYGKAEPPFDENTLFKPSTPYETAKACQDLIAQNYFVTFGVPVVIVRPVNVFGPSDANQSRLIPKVCLDINAGRAPKVYSSVRNSKREFVYIDDAIDAFLLVMEKGVAGDSYLVGGDRATVYEVIEELCSISDFRGGVDIFDDGSVLGFDDHQINQSKIEQLGYSRKVTLREGLLRSYRSYR